MQPHSVGESRYRLRMPSKDDRADPRVVLWANVEALMTHHWGKPNLTKLAETAGIGPGTASRLKAQETYAQLDTLDKIAEVFELQPWQLLVPGLEPDIAPVLAHASEAERKLYRKFLAVKKVLETDGNGEESGGPSK